MNNETATLRRAGTMQGFLLAMSSVLTVMAVVVLVPVMPTLMHTFSGIPNAGFWVPSLLSLPGLCAALFAPVAGSLGDRFNKHYLITGFAIAYCVFGAMPAVLSDFALIAATRIIVGASAAAVLVLSMALIGDYFDDLGRERWLSVQAMAATLSSLAVMPLAGLLGAWLGWHGAFLAYLLIMPLAIGLGYFCWDPRSESNTPVESAPWSALPWSWMIGFCLISIATAMLFYALQLQLGLTLAAVGVIDSAMIGTLSAVAMIGVPAGAFLFMKVAHFPFARLLSIELLVAGATLAALKFCSLPVLVGVAFLNLAACGMMLPTMVTHISKRLHPAVRGRGIGIWQSAFSIGQFFSVSGISLVMRSGERTVLDALGTYGTVAAVGAAVALVVTLRSPARVSQVRQNTAL